MNTYYVWTADGDCQNKTEDFAVACTWALEMRGIGAYIADQDQKVHRAAWEPAERQSISSTQKALAKSLACYVTGDDIVLTREQFLRTVAGRIADDLFDSTF